MKHIGGLMRCIYERPFMAEAEAPLALSEREQHYGR